jgi:DNA modification methylase
MCRSVCLGKKRLRDYKTFLFREDMNKPDISKLITEVDRYSIDRDSIPQNSLDLTEVKRRSVFPWRGQFSPELIELLLKHYANKDNVVLDPFVGSGTVLFEAGRMSLECYGVEINPAAIEIARMSHFINIDPKKREEYIKRAESIIIKHIPSIDRFSSPRSGIPSFSESLEEVFIKTLNETEDDFIRNIIICTFMRHVISRGEDSQELLLTFKRQAEVIRELPYSQKTCKVICCDARTLPFERESIDLVITSPPYINVFNYHQNYRRLMELVGWDMLYVAKSEIGSNRKNRGNRFLTVIQYAIDMLQALCEMRRVVRRGGRIIIVIGRESRIRGISFKNYRILASLAVGGASLKLICRQERRYINRFGEQIFEDILHFTPSDSVEIKPDDELARAIARHFLEESITKASGETYDDIKAAIECCKDIQASPIFDVKRAKTNHTRYINNPFSTAASGSHHVLSK